MHSMDLDDHLATVHDPEANTFQWIFQTSIITDLWVSPSSTIVHLTGKPGCGKSVLAKMLYKESIERIARGDAFVRKEKAIEGCLDSNTVPLLFFACKDTDAKRRTASNLLSGLIAQIVDYLGAEGNKSSLLVPLSKMHGRRAGRVDNSSDFWTWPLLLDIFVNLVTCGSFQSIICVIDALDECAAGTERNSLLDCFETVVKKSNQNGSCFRFLITSRSYHDLRFDQSHACHIELDYEDNMNADLDIFIRAGVSKLLKKRPGYKFHQSRVIEALHERADKMYLLVGLLLQILEENTDSSPDAVAKALFSLPSDVSGVYHRIWSRIKSEDRDRAELWFSWILLAFESLSIEQFAAALVVRNAHTDDYDLELYQCLKENLQEDLQRLFGPLLRFMILESSGEVHIELSHQTVKEYFLTSPDSEIPSASAERVIHTEMANVCQYWDPFGSIELSHHTVKEYFLHHTVKEYFLTSPDSEIPSASAERVIHTEMANVYHYWDPFSMFDAVQEHFGESTIHWTLESIMKAATLVARQIVSTEASNPNLPRILRESSFSSYAYRYWDRHIGAALLDIILDVAPSLETEGLSEIMPILIMIESLKVKRNKRFNHSLAELQPSAESAV